MFYGDICDRSLRLKGHLMARLNVTMSGVPPSVLLFFVGTARINVEVYFSYVAFQTKTSKK